MDIPAGGAAAARRNIVAVVALAYGAIALHNLAILALGGVHAVPLILFGLGQLTPALAVFLYQRSYVTRLKSLLLAPVPPRVLAFSYLLATLTMASCVLLPYLFGAARDYYGPAAIESYPLGVLIPNVLLTTDYFLIYVLVGAPLVHLLTATGEEILWRGYLLDEMLKVYSKRTTYWLNGVCWGLWHTPMIVLLDWDFPGHPVLGVVAITLSQIAWSTVMVHLRLKTGSLWPPIVIHAVANAMTIALFDPLIEPSYNLYFSPWSLLGGVIMAAVALVVTRTETRRASAVVPS